MKQMKSFGINLSMYGKILKPSDKKTKEELIEIEVDTPIEIN